MSAGTQGFTDTREDTNHIGKVISTILEARKLAEDERKYAEDQAEKYQTSLEEAGIKRGDFFKKALRWKFGGEFKQKKLAQVKTWKTRGKLLKGAVTGKSGQNKLDKFERSQAIFDMFSAKDKPKTFRDKFKKKYEGFVDDPMTRPMSHLVKPGTAKKIQKATGKKKRVSKEDILDSLGAITESIQKVAESISEKNKIVADQMIHSSVLQGMLHQELKTSGNSLDDKLQKIINALSNQTHLEKEIVEKSKSKDTEDKLESRRDAASIVNFDNLLTKEDESKEVQSDAYAQRDMWRDEMLQNKELPQAESGATFVAKDNSYQAELHGKEASVSDKGNVKIYDGPDEGYPVNLTGNQKIIPIDNNFTQGQRSAVDGKVRPKPQQSMMPKYEMGTDSTTNAAPITSKFGFNTTQNITGIAGGGTTEASKLTQSMVDVMSLPMMAAGGAILSATTKYMQSLGSEGENINPEIDRLSRPVASVFGLPPSIVNATKKSGPKQKFYEDKDIDGGESKRDLFAKLTDGFGSLLEKLGDGINKKKKKNDGDGEDTNADTSSLGNFIGAVESGNSYTKLVGGAEDKSILNKTITQLDQEKGEQFAMGKYQIQMRTAKDVLKGKGIDPSTFVFNEEGQDKLFKMLLERRGLGDFMSGKITREQFALNLSKEWAALPKDAGGRSFYAGDGTNKAHRTWEDTLSMIDKLKASGGDPLAKNNPTTSPTKTTPAQLGQAITSNYGLKVGQERSFTHPQYGVIKAHKTATGFDFYRPGFNEILDMSKPQGKAIVEYFKSTNGGQQQISPPSTEEQKISSISKSNSSKSSGGKITALNIGGSKPIASAGSSNQPSGSDGTQSSTNPTRDYFANQFSLGI